MTKETKQYGHIEKEGPWAGEYMSTSYGMFSESGDILVEGIVLEAKKYNHSWGLVFDQLITLAKNKKYGEATDTMVRELVFDTIGYSDDTPFYI